MSVQAFHPSRGARAVRVHYSPYKGIAALISAVDAGEIDYAVVPAENSYEGSVSPTWDILFHDSSAEIIREVLVSVRHHLLVQRGPSSRQ